MKSADIEIVRQKEFQEKLRSLSFHKPSNAPKVTTDVHDEGTVDIIEHHDGERQDIIVKPNTIVRKLGII